MSERVSRTENSEILLNIEKLRDIIEQTDLRFFLDALSQVDIPGSYIVGGAVRNTVWKYMFPDSTLKVNDIDVPYFSLDLPPSADDKFDRALEVLYPDYPWECANQANVHEYDRVDDPWVMPNAPYSSLEDSMLDFWFSVNRIGVRYDDSGELQVLNPGDLTDLFAGILRVLPNQLNNPYQWFEDKISKITDACPQITVIRQ